MHVHVVSIHPQFIEAYTHFGVLKAALSKNKVSFHICNLRDHAVDKHGSVDDRPYGGGDGMVLRPEPLAAAVKNIPGNPYVLLTSAKGKAWTQADARRLLHMDRPLVFICGRFGGVDERFIENYVDEQVSMGDFIVSGGELPALMMIDSILRLVPDVLGHSESAHVDSFSEGLKGLLEHPLYTKPQVFEDSAVPDVLLSGDHQAIERWRQKEALRVTRELRPDLLFTTPD